MQPDNPATIRIRVLFFATARLHAGVPEADLIVPTGSTVGGALDLLAGLYPRLAPLLPSLLVAVDEEWAPRSAALKGGDTVAVMPPVSGG